MFIQVEPHMKSVRNIFHEPNDVFSDMMKDDIGYENENKYLGKGTEDAVHVTRYLVDPTSQLIAEPKECSNIVTFETPLEQETDTIVVDGDVTYSIASPIYNQVSEQLLPSHKGGNVCIAIPEEYFEEQNEDELKIDRIDHASKDLKRRADESSTNNPAASGNVEWSMAKPNPSEETGNLFAVHKGGDVSIPIPEFCLGKPMIDHMDIYSEDFLKGAGRILPVDKLFDSFKSGKPIQLDQPDAPNNNIETGEHLFIFALYNYCVVFFFIVAAILIILLNVSVYSK